MKLVPHAFLTMDGERGHVVFDLSTPQGRDGLMAEIADDQLDWGDPNHADDGQPLFTVLVRGMPEGYAETLPEFQGW